MWRGGKGAGLESRNVGKREQEVVCVMSKSMYWSPSCLYHQADAPTRVTQSPLS